jgi:hypothetical protein
MLQNIDRMMVGVEITSEAGVGVEVEVGVGVEVEVGVEAEVDMWCILNSYNTY